MEIGEDYWAGPNICCALVDGKCGTKDKFYPDESIASLVCYYGKRKQLIWKLYSMPSKTLVSKTDVGDYWDYDCVIWNPKPVGEYLIEVEYSSGALYDSGTFEVINKPIDWCYLTVRALDYDSKDPISNVKVTIRDLVDYTDNDGNTSPFKLKPSTVAEWIKLEKEGYETVESTIAIPFKEEATQIILMKKSKNEKITVKVIVTDKDTGESMYDAQVKLDSEEKYTDKDGVVSFKTEADVEFELTVSQVGYKYHKDNYTCSADCDIAVELEKYIEPPPDTEPPEKEKEEDYTMYYIIGGVVLLILILYMMKK